MKLLGALQRTYFPTWDIWSRKFSWPRKTFGKAKEETIILVPDPQPKDGAPTTKKELLKQRLDMSYSAENYLDPALDSTVYLGQKGGDIMARIYDKTIDQQHHDGQHVVLEDIDHRARVEVSFRGEALKELGLTDIASLRLFRLARVNKLFSSSSFQSSHRQAQRAPPIQLFRLIWNARVPKSIRGPATLGSPSEI